MSSVPIVSREQVYSREAKQALQSSERPSYWGVDADPARRPGVPMERTPVPFPNTQFPPEHQRGVSASPTHGRSNKMPPPVFGTAIPLKGLAGRIKRLAYALPDHKPEHWLLMLLGDRVDSWTYHAKKYSVVLVPLGVAVLLTARARRKSQPRAALDRALAWARG